MKMDKLRTALELEERELEAQLTNVRRALHHLRGCQVEMGKGTVAA